MTTTEIVVFLWLGVINGVLIWLCFERDRLLKEIKKLDFTLGYVWDRTVKKEQSK